MAQLMKVDNFNELEVNNPDHFLIVKVLSTWKWPMFKNPKLTYSVEMMLLDQQGNRIQSSCLSQFLNRFQSFFLEQNVISIQKPIFGENGGSWRFVDHPLKVCFNNDTVVQRVDNWSGSDHGFNFISFERIIDKQVSFNLSTDVIGEVIWSSPKRFFKDNKNQDGVRISVKLQDLSGNRIWLTLFGRFCDQFCKYISEHPELTHFTFIIQFGKFSIYEGKYSVSNVFNGTKLFFNSDKVKEIVSFREKFLETWEEQSTSSLISISNSIEYNMEKDFLISTDYSHTAEVDSFTKKKDLIVLGTIVYIQPKWFYPACNHCNKIVQRTDEGDEVSYCCSNPICIKEKRVINPYSRIKILLKVQDSAGTVDMTMFESVAKQIIKKTAIDFAAPLISKTAAIAEPLPKELQDLIDRKFAFKISVTEFNIENRYKFYTVIKVTDDPIIISALEKKYNHDEVSDPQGSNTSQKDCLGISPSVVTPDSVNMAVKVIDCDRESDSLKRNLYEVYDAISSFNHILY
ncbi:hypothetical protein SSX86_016972 [Deinandra increscens subsp. villosa]|uniref:Replication factor A C-terminal domain-containing protein n=1 Tax=Deinandra increscens subsp. villosa TaxID=3103831 RepID=A0AAP0GWK0_9ASTR